MAKLTDRLPQAITDAARLVGAGATIVSENAKLGSGTDIVAHIDSQVLSHVETAQLHRLLALSKEHYQRLNRGARLHEHACIGCGRTVTCCCKDRRQVDRLSMQARRIRCVECVDMGEMSEEASDVT